MGNQQANHFSDKKSSSTFSSVSPTVTTSLHFSPSSITSSSSTNPPVHTSPSSTGGTHTHLSPSTSLHLSPSSITSSSSTNPPVHTSPSSTSGTHTHLSPSINPSTQYSLHSSSTPNVHPNPHLSPAPLISTVTTHHQTQSFNSVIDTDSHTRRRPYVHNPYPPYHEFNLSQIQTSTNTEHLHLHPHFSPSSIEFSSTYVPPVLTPSVSLAPSSTPNLYTPFPAPYSSISSQTHQLLTPSSSGTPFLINPQSLPISISHGNSIEGQLVDASFRNNHSSIRSLIEQGADINCVVNTGRGEVSPLMMVSVTTGDTDTIKLLLNNGALVNQQNKNGVSSLMMASFEGHVDAARLLLQYGADVNLKSNNKDTALCYALVVEMVDLLMLASIPQLTELLLPLAHKWRELGKRLSLDEATLDSFQTIEEEENRLQAVMTAWSKQPCTWRRLIKVVTSMESTIGKRMSDLSKPRPKFCYKTDTTYAVMNGVESDKNKSEVKHLAAVQQAMEIKGILEHALVHGVFVGPAGSGKSSSMSRLLGEMPSSTSSSTGVANRVVQVEVKKSSSIAVSVLNTFSDSTWVKILYDEEAIRFMTQVTAKQETISTLTEQKNPLPVMATKHYDVKPHPVQVHPAISIDTQQDIPVRSSVNTPNITGSKSVITTLSYPAGYVTPMGVFKNALHQGQLEKLRQHFENSWSLYLTDTGGQMEFQEVLPLLVSGPSIFFITFRLDQDLKQRFTIQYRLPDGGRSEPYESSLTVEEAILQTLASVASMGTFTYEGPQMKSTPLKPKVLIVGTHKDKLDQSTVESKIKEIDEHLQKLIKSTSHYRKDLVEFSSESQLIFTVNNFSAEDSDFKKIRSSVERVVQQSNFRMSYPSHWLIFSLVLRQQMIKDIIISFEQCFAIAQDCGITDLEELNHALWFLHTKIGLIRHFPTPGLKDVVIRDPQVLFDQVTHLIVKTFTFNEVGERRSTEFKNQGIFSFEDFKHVVQSSSHFLPPEKLLLLLEELRIVASFQTDEGDIKYFLPCVLAHSEVCSSPVPTSDIPPLLITFKCGYCPKGLAGALIVYLLTNEMGSKFKWELEIDQIFRNQVSFLVSPYDFITLKIHPTFLECIHYSALKESEQKSIRTKQYVLETVCGMVFDNIKKGIQKISSDLNFTSDAKHTLNFYCQHADCVQSNGPHPATECMSDEDGLCSLRCKRSGKVVISCPPAGCSVWFGKESQVECDPDHEKASRHPVMKSPPMSLMRESSEVSVPPDDQTNAPPTLVNLTLLKWKDEHGHKQTLRLIQTVSPEWRKLGALIGLSGAQLQALPVKHLNDIQQCCLDVFIHWLENPPPEYPVTWEGLCELLDDLEFSQVAVTLKEALYWIQTERRGQEGLLPPAENQIFSDW